MKPQKLILFSRFDRKLLFLFFFRGRDEKTYAAIVKNQKFLLFFFSLSSVDSF
jgi:hypothetical protein